jgi:hypothetical protein
MTDSDQHPYVEWIAREAQRPVVTDSAARERIMQAVRSEPAPQRRSRVWQRVLEPRAFRLSPITTTLLAAGLVGIGVISGKVVNNRDVQPSVGEAKPPAVVQQLPVSDTVVKFVFVAPRASQVSVVGDFNGWNASTTPMVRTPNDSVWTVTLPLTTGSVTPILSESFVEVPRCDSIRPHGSPCPLPPWPRTAGGRIAVRMRAS